MTSTWLQASEAAHNDVAALQEDDFYATLLRTW
jgi:hypothetical protein